MSSQYVFLTICFLCVKQQGSHQGFKMMTLKERRAVRVKQEVMFSGRQLFFLFWVFSFHSTQMWTRSGQNSSGQGRDHQPERVCFNMSIWKILQGDMKESAADVALCLHAWIWGSALWSDWKRTTEVCTSGESKVLLTEQIRRVSRLRIFPGLPAESTFCDQRCGNTTAPPLDPTLSWHNLRPVAIAAGDLHSVPVTDRHRLQASSHRVHFRFISARTEVLVMFH